MSSLITIQDILIVPLLLMVAYFVATRTKNKNIAISPHYKYFRIGLFVKIWSGLAFAFIYLLYYGGGDTTYYFHGTQCTVNMIGKDMPTFFKLIFGNHTPEVGSMFDRNTGYPFYFKDPNSFAVCRFNVAFYLIGFCSFLGNTVIMNLFLYIVVWRFYEMVIKIFPNQEKALAIAVLFIPSTVFWSSGILKDSWTLAAIYAIFIHLYNMFVLKKKMWANILGLLLWSYIAFSIRPYIFYVAIGSGLIWIGLNLLKSIESSFLRTLAFPLIILSIWLAGVTILAKTSSIATKRYSSIENMMETAQIIQDDLRKDYYGGNSFDIGYFEPTFSGILSKFPKAVTAGLFRPFLWEANSIFMLLSGLESILLLIFIAYLFIKTKVFGFFKAVFSDDFLVALLIFAITLAFFVGLTTANFGALVRYRIPVLPLFLIILINVFKKNRKLNPDEQSDMPVAPR